MGIIKDLKNIFFGASSVTKHAAEKATDFIKEEGDVLLDKTKDLASKSGEILSDKTSGLKDAVLEGSGNIVDKAKDTFSDLSDGLSENPMVQKAADFTEGIGEKVMSTGDTILDKAKGISENVGEKVLDTGGDVLDKGKNLSEDIGEKVLSVKDDLMEKAMETKDKVSEKLNETMDKADAWAEAEKLKPKKEFADDTIDASGSLLEGKDDFFAKADKFASGEYDSFSEGKITIDETKAIEKPDFEELPPASGFKDLDGDGNEIIDDAIIEDGDSETDS